MQTFVAGLKVVIEKPPLPDESTMYFILIVMSSKETHYAQEQLSSAAATITEHLYVDQYPIHHTDETLILGTIHPHEADFFMMPFFYGNKNSIWNLMRDAFPQELSASYTLDDVLLFLHSRNIAVSDTILRCARLDDGASDDKLVPLALNMALTEQIRHSDIQQIFCTSGFGKNSAFRLFYEGILGLKLTAEIRQTKQVVLPESIFGRPVRVDLLPSPSGAANIALARSAAFKKSRYYGQEERPVYRYKVSLYQKLFAQ